MLEITKDNIIDRFHLIGPINKVSKEEILKEVFSKQVKRIFPNKPPRENTAMRITSHLLAEGWLKIDFDAYNYSRLLEELVRDEYLTKSINPKNPTVLLYQRTDKHYEMENVANAA